MVFRNDSEHTLYVNADRTKVVRPNKDGTVPDEAAFVLVGPGGQLEDAEARKYGLLDPPKAAAPAATKAVAPKENK